MDPSNLTDYHIYLIEVKTIRQPRESMWSQMQDLFTSKFACLIMNLGCGVVETCHFSVLAVC